MNRSRIVALVFALAAGCGGGGGGGAVPDTGPIPDGGVLRGDDDASMPAPRDASMDASMPPPRDGSMPPPMDGSMPPPMDGSMMMGPRPCMMESECADACPMFAMGCTCHDTPMGRACIPICNVDQDCPMPPNGMRLVCDTNMHICVPG